MAVAVVKFKNGKKSMGVPHFDYIMRDGKYAIKADDLERLVTADSGNMPEWAMNDPKFYWSMADELERENGRIYKEHIIALPRGLDDQQLEQLARDLIKEHIGDKHPYSFAIHAPLATDGLEQPHLHFMYSERTLDGIERGSDTFFKRYNSKHPERGGCKKANLAMRKGEARQQAKELRYRIGDTINRHLELANRPERVDMRSKRDIERLELEQAQAELSQELAELEQLEQVADFTQSDLADVLNRLQLEQAEIVVKPEPPRTAQAYLDDLKRQLGQTVAPVEQPQIPPPPKPQPERDPHALIQEYDKKRHSLAERFFKTELKDLVIKINALVAKYKDLQASKPRFFGKDKWQDEVTATRADHTATKATYDKVKNGGITIMHFQKATDYLTKHEQDFCNQVDQARQTLIDQARMRELERQQAKATQTYPEPSSPSVDSGLIRSDRVFEQPEPQPQTPPTVAERLEMVSIDRLRYETRKGLEQIKAHIEAMPDLERQNKAIVDFNRVVSEQLEKQTQQNKGMDR